MQNHDTTDPISNQPNTGKTPSQPEPKPYPTRKSTYRDPSCRDHVDVMSHWNPMMWEENNRR